ncbi:hypothetical protein ACFCX4_08985 [Kitasatospora sp. NPDC056327]|uniref:hypothetical protein n=1 Tax=Kitasatospora sp. NPDC056327 TaxID=3345785 RepID=UPI0035DAEE6B
MTNNLTWIEADELRLTSNLIPNPTNQSQLLNQLSSIRIALDNGFVHIDPRPTNGTVPVDRKAEYEVLVVPASAIESVRYRVVPKSSRLTVHN